MTTFSDLIERIDHVINKVPFIESAGLAIVLRELIVRLDEQDRDKQPISRPLRTKGE